MESKITQLYYLTKTAGNRRFLHRNNRAG